MTASIAEAARRIAAARVSRTSFAGLPDDLRPRDEPTAYAVQDAVREALLNTAFGRAIGFKLGCTTPVMQRELGMDHPCAGTMYQGGLLPNGAVLNRSDYVRPGVECELAITLARPLSATDGPFDRAAVMNAVGSVHAAIEVVDERYDDWTALGAETLIADDYFHAGLVLGPAVSDWRALALQDVRGIARINGKVIGEGRGADVMGHPVAALEWLANHCAGRGTDVPAGTIVSLGSVVSVWWLTPGETVEMEFDGLGALQVRYG